MLIIEDLTTQYENNPLGIDVQEPGFGWKLRAGNGERSKRQSAYRILVAASRERLHANIGDCWDSGNIASAQSQHIVYKGGSPTSRTRYYWKVKVWDEHGLESDWSDVGYWETGLMETGEWEGNWITAPFLNDPIPEPDRLAGVPVIWDEARISGGDGAIRFFRLGFKIESGDAVEAKLQIYAADSVYVYVNGHDEGLYFPYEQSVTLDVGHLLREGNNVLACSSDGEKKGFIAVLSLISEEGKTRLYTTEEGWKTTGDREDGWFSPNFDDGHWRNPVPIGRFGHGEWGAYKRILYPVNTGIGPAPLFRKFFRIDKPVAQARLYMSALGVYQCYANGLKISADVFAPGWTDYRIRIPYQTYDLTEMLHIGDNLLETAVGPGWYAGLIGICGPHHYGGRVACRAQLYIAYEDGASEVFSTGDDWLTAVGPVRSADMFMGEVYDARMEEPSDWCSAILLDTHPRGAMTAAVGPPIRPMRQLAPKSVSRTDNGTYLVDMGQNMVGWIRLRASGTRGTEVVIRYAERLTPNGTLYTLNLRTAKQTDRYTMKGAGVEIYEPSFTYHGFQYVEISGYPGELSVADITGIVVHSALEEVGELTTSNPLINRLLDNIRWSQRGNFFGIPLDCPQRDERLGWTGDAHAFARTATYNMNAARFYEKWLTDIRDAQRADGAYPNVAPDVENLGAGFVFFGDGGVIIPWTMYKVYGDKRFIESNYEAMVKYIDFLLGDCDERLLRRTETFGDHLAYGSETPKSVINAAFFAYSVKLMAEMSAAIGKAEDAAKYAELFGRLKTAFQTHFVEPDGRIAGDTQTAYVLGLMIGLLPEKLIPAAARHLADNIRDHGWHLTTGFMGVSYLLTVLTEYGQTETAFRLLLQETFPSWLYPVTQGATTIWERWDGWNEEKGFQDPEMNSFNHYALGSVGEWLYRYLAGIDIAEGEAGFQHFLIRPTIGGEFTRVHCRSKTLYGWIESSWTVEGGGFVLRVEVPVNTTAEIVIPFDQEDIWINGMRAIESGMSAVRTGWTDVRMEDGQIRVAAGSGHYEIKMQQMNVERM